MRSNTSSPLPSVDVDEDGVVQTAFLETAEAVPSTAHFFGGAAFAQDGAKYVCADEPDQFLGGIGHREDGAACIEVGGTIAAYQGGIALTAGGKIVATDEAPELVHQGIGMLEDGTVCMSEVEADE